jgi:3-oxoacyl-[acyl-carrier protein] reductase
MKNKWAAITGPSKGLGKRLAEQFWSAGYNLCLIGRDANLIQNQIKNLPEQKNQRVVFFRCDLSDPQQVQILANELQRECPKINVLINNAAIQGPIGFSWEVSFDEWKTALNVNLLAPIAICRAVIPLMIANGGGSIINLSGGGATGPRANFSSYATAKAGLVRFSETLAEETRHYNIKVNCIAPGAMKTAMLAELIEKGSIAAGLKEFELAQKVFAQGGASMELVAELALFLASPKSDGITGKLISAVWDNWNNWPNHVEELSGSDAYTLRRIAGRDRGFKWGDK